MHKIGVVIATVAFFGLGIAACEREGPAERAGENVDRAIDRAGESMDRAGDRLRERSEDARDRNADTPPPPESNVNR